MNDMKDKYDVSIFNFNQPRFWSSPGVPVSGKKIIYSVLTNPDFYDLLKVFKFFGSVQVISEFEVIRKDMNVNLEAYVGVILDGMKKGLPNV